MHVNPLGKTGLSVTSVCLGTSPLGNFPSQYGYEVSAEQAVATVTRALEGPITFIDTSNNYGDGESERRIGKALADAGGLPEGFVLATKVDPLPGSDDFSGDRVRASVRESQERLGIENLQLVYLHDPERITFEEATAPGGAVEALVQLKEDGVIQHIGVAGGPIDLERQYVGLGVFDAVISHNRYTLVDQSATPLIEDAAERGVAFVNAAPYGGGMLVRGPDAVPTYCYQPASAETIDRVRKMQAACAERDVPLAAAALQFSLRDQRVASTIVGMSSPERVEQTVSLAEWQIDDDLWSELQELAAPGRDGVGL
jgi:D-threo-aldose 1-dehydrogenase